MRGHGDDHRRGSGGPLLRTVPVTSVEEVHDDSLASDLIFDFSEMETLDVKGLAMLLTAQQVADKNERTVWLAGLPGRVWDVFRAMGLDEYFRVFPGRDATRS